MTIKSDERIREAYEATTKELIARHLMLVCGCAICKEALKRIVEDDAQLDFRTSLQGMKL